MTLTILRYTRHSQQGERERRDYTQTISDVIRTDQKKVFFKYRDALKPRNLNREVAREHCTSISYNFQSAKDKTGRRILTNIHPKQPKKRH